MVIADIREILTLSKHTVQTSGVERFNLKALSELEVRKQ